MAFLRDFDAFQTAEANSLVRVELLVTLKLVVAHGDADLAELASRADLMQQDVHEDLLVQLPVNAGPPWNVIGLDDFEVRHVRTLRERVEDAEELKNFVAQLTVDPLKVGTELVDGELSVRYLTREEQLAEARLSHHYFAVLVQLQALILYLIDQRDEAPSSLLLRVQVRLLKCKLVGHDQIVLLLYLLEDKVDLMADHVRVVDHRNEGATLIAAQHIRQIHV